MANVLWSVQVTVKPFLFIKCPKEECLSESSDPVIFFTLMGGFNCHVYCMCIISTSRFCLQFVYRILLCLGGFGKDSDPVYAKTIEPVS